jgi:hypothetical protein
MNSENQISKLIEKSKNIKKLSTNDLEELNNIINYFEDLEKQEKETLFKVDFNNLIDIILKQKPIGKEDNDKEENKFSTILTNLSLLKLYVEDYKKEQQKSSKTKTKSKIKGIGD